MPCRPLQLIEATDREHLLFVTGTPARDRPRRVLEELPERRFSFEVRVPGVSVAALVTADPLPFSPGTAGADT